MAGGDLRVRAWTWKLLHDAYASRLGSGDWSRLEALAGAIGVLERPHEDLLPLGPFLEALQHLDATLGVGRGDEMATAGRELAVRWGAFYAPLVRQMEGRPQNALSLLRSSILPGAFFDAAAVDVAERGEREVDVRFDPGLPRAFWEGLTTGFVELTGARPFVRRSGEDVLHVSWSFSGHAPARTAWAALRSAVRLPFLAATLVPVLVGWSLAARGGPLDPVAALLTLLGVVLFQGGANALNDHYDASPVGHDRGAEPVRRHLRTLAYALYGAGTIVGLALVVLRGVEILWLGLAGVLLGLLYSAPPVRLAHRGLGELAAAIGFGPLLVVGTYFAQRQAWSMAALLASFPLAIVIAAVLYINEFPDREGDARVGKRTLIVRLPERSAVMLYVALHGLVYLLILGGVALGSVPQYAAYAFPPWSLLGLLTLPLAYRASVLVARNYRYPYRLVAANPAVVRLHLATGALFAVGYLVAGWT